MLPANVTKEKIIGYTGTRHKNPTVYFTLGHFTQVHTNAWNIGWDSYAGWQCKFFGNIREMDERNGKASSHTIRGGKKETVPPDDYVAKLEMLGHNRFARGGQDFDLKTLGDEKPNYILREFWIRGNGEEEKDRFAHPSRHWFIPVKDEATRAELWGEVYARLTASQKIGRFFTRLVARTT